MFAAGLEDVVDDIILADTCAGCHILRNLSNCFTMIKYTSWEVSGIGGADNKSMSTHVGYLSILLKCYDTKTVKDSTLWIIGNSSSEPNVVVVPDSPLIILSLNILYDHGFRTNGDCSEMWHKECTHNRV